jgi:hypothetical protein
MTIEFDHGAPPNLRELADGAEQLARRSLVDQAKYAVHRVNQLLAASGATCRLRLPQAQVDAVTDAASGNLIYKCRHSAPHEWDLDGKRIR